MMSREEERMADASIRVTYRIETAAIPRRSRPRSPPTSRPAPSPSFPARPRRCAPAAPRGSRRCSRSSRSTRPSLPDPGGSGPYRRAEVVIAYPLEAVGTDIAALMTITVGGVFAVRGLTGLRVLDFELPPAWSCHPGPQFGIEGSRRLMGVTAGPDDRLDHQAVARPAARGDRRGRPHALRGGRRLHQGRREADEPRLLAARGPGRRDHAGDPRPRAADRQDR